ncbi:MAG: long-chain fatty acid--CoA ligase [Ignavibacteriales bacterium]|nr:long-chain fatty acid--CoA ligase [Ignavibacteriales bacterium]
MTEFDWFAKWSTYTPNKEAILEYSTGRTFTYAQLNHLANQLSLLLMSEYNIKKSDRVAVLAENCIEYAILFGVAQKLGITLVPINYRLAQPELEFIISDCSPSLLLYEDKFEDKVNSDKIKNSCYELLPMTKISTTIHELTSMKIASENISSNIEEDDAIFILYTSGTTAFPKGAIYTHKMLFWNSINTELRLDITSNDRSISCAPPFHTGSWNVLFTPFLHHGAFTIILKKFDADTELELMDKQGITLWWAVPTMLKMMTDSQNFNITKMEKLRYIVVGGEALPLEVIRTWHNKGVPIRQGYGLTEVGPNVTSLNQEDAERKLGSIGTPNFYIQTKIIDENGNEVLNEGTGEFLLKGPNVTPGYWKNEEATAIAIHDGWFSTGDVVKRDDEGFLYVVDRIKNMYISGGENVYPAEVEHLLRQHNEISDLAIVGVPDDKWGEVGKAFIVRTEGSTLNEDDVKMFCLAKLAKYKIPKHVEFLEELPTNDAGKIDRKKLREL